MLHTTAFMRALCKWGVCTQHRLVLTAQLLKAGLTGYMLQAVAGKGPNVAVKVYVVSLHTSKPFPAGLLPLMENVPAVSTGDAAISSDMTAHLPKDPAAPAKLKL